MRRLVILSTKWHVGQWCREKQSIRGRVLHGTVQVSQERSEESRMGRFAALSVTACLLRYCLKRIGKPRDLYLHRPS